MLRYYDERASEYEEAYVRVRERRRFPTRTCSAAEASLLTGVVERFARGRIVDLACGTGYWLPHYAGRCSSITLVDQSGRMLDECRKKTDALGVADRCTVVQADVFEHAVRRSARTTARSSVSS